MRVGLTSVGGYWPLDPLIPELKLEPLIPILGGSLFSAEEEKEEKVEEEGDWEGMDGAGEGGALALEAFLRAAIEALTNLCNAATSCIINRNGGNERQLVNTEKNCS